MRASSRGLGELIHAALAAGRMTSSLPGRLGTVDGGAGLLEVLGAFPVPVAPPATSAIRCSAARRRARLRAAEGRPAEQVEELEARLAAREACGRSRTSRRGAAGGLGAALAALGAELVRAELVLGLIGFASARAPPPSSSPARERSTRGRSRGRLPARRCASAARRASAAPSSAAGSWSSFRARSYTSSAAIPRVRARIWSPSAGCWPPSVSRAARSCLASAWSSFHAMCALPSTSGRNSQEVRP